MSPEQLAAISGIVLSLLLSYFPFVKSWYNPLPSEQKVTVTGLLLVLVAVGALLYNCQGQFACVAGSWQDALNVLIAALVANQSTYLLAVKPFAKS